MNRPELHRTTTKSSALRTSGSARHVIVLAATVLALSSSACGTVTNLTNVWRSPDFEAESMRRILVVAIASTPMRRRSFEDSFANALAGQNVEATPSYRLLPSDDQLTRAELRGAVEGNKFDGVIVTRLMGVEEETIVVPPPERRAARIDSSTVTPPTSRQDVGSSSSSNSGSSESAIANATRRISPGLNDNGARPG